jgi:hypothetical protein
MQSNLVVTSEILDADLLVMDVSGALPARYVDMLWGKGLRRLGDLLLHSPESLSYALHIHTERGRIEIEEAQATIRNAIEIVKENPADWCYGDGWNLLQHFARWPIY